MSIRIESMKKIWNFVSFFPFNISAYNRYCNIDLKIKISSIPIKNWTVDWINLPFVERHTKENNYLLEWEVTPNALNNLLFTFMGYTWNQLFVNLSSKKKLFFFSYFSLLIDRVSNE